MIRITSESGFRLPRLFRRRPTLEVHVPIAPTPSFLNQLRCLTHSLRRFGGAYRHAPVIATVGGPADPGLADRMPWLRKNGIELRWVPEAEFTRMGMYATGSRRLQHEFQADMVLLLDADTLIRRPLDALIETTHRDGVVAGVIAHYSPLLEWRSREQPSWADFFALLGLKTPALDHEHTGWGYFFSDARYRYCPPYFNYGVIAAPARVISRIGRVAEHHLIQLREALGTYFDAQLAFTASIVELGLPTRALPMRYNMGNNPLVESLHHREIDRAVILHLLHEHQNRRVETFESISHLRDFVNRGDLRVTNLMAQDVIRTILPALEAEEQTTSQAAA